MYNKIMKIKCIVCDLDETLLDSHSQIPKQNIEAIALIKKRGIKFVPATGRHFKAISSILDILDLKDCENEYVLSLNGALISENKNNRLLSSTAMNSDSAMKLLHYGFQKEVCLEVYTDKNTYLIHPRDNEKQVFKEYGIDYLEIDQVESLKDETFLKIIFENTDMTFLKSLEADVLSLVTDISLSYSSNRYMELNALNVSKGNALKMLCEILNISTDETMAIGDHFNDVSMLSVAGLSCAVSNAQEDVKKICDVVLTKTNSEGAVGQAIYEYVLKEDRHTS